MDLDTDIDEVNITIDNLCIALDDLGDFLNKDYERLLEDSQRLERLFSTFTHHLKWLIHPTERESDIAIKNRVKLKYPNQSDTLYFLKTLSLQPEHLVYRPVDLPGLTRSDIHALWIYNLKQARHFIQYDLSHAFAALKKPKGPFAPYQHPFELDVSPLLVVANFYHQYDSLYFLKNKRVSLLSINLDSEFDRALFLSHLVEMGEILHQAPPSLKSAVAQHIHPDFYQTIKIARNQFCHIEHNIDLLEDFLLHGKIILNIKSKSVDMKKLLHQCQQLVQSCPSLIVPKAQYSIEKKWELIQNQIQWCAPMPQQTLVPLSITKTLFTHQFKPTDQSMKTFFLSNIRQNVSWILTQQCRCFETHDLPLMEKLTFVLKYLMIIYGSLIQVVLNQNQASIVSHPHYDHFQSAVQIRNQISHIGKLFHKEDSIQVNEVFLSNTASELISSIDLEVTLSHTDI
ncbi:MAG: hypothetical protein CMF42_04870 [Legionellales bacterium]|nr:hypothetical protein [Legionellales bacterium]OUX67350.1 MAG: hypothetical protein CBD38_03060 [bacterium TMED178]